MSDCPKSSNFPEFSHALPPSLKSSSVVLRKTRHFAKYCPTETLANGKERGENAAICRQLDIQLAGTVLIMPGPGRGALRWEETIHCAQFFDGQDNLSRLSILFQVRDLMRARNGNEKIALLKDPG
jgi:hypothetical protein